MTSPPLRCACQSQQALAYPVEAKLKSQKRSKDRVGLYAGLALIGAKLFGRDMVKKYAVLFVRSIRFVATGFYFYEAKWAKNGVRNGLSPRAVVAQVTEDVQICGEVLSYYGEDETPLAVRAGRSAAMACVPLQRVHLRGRGDGGIATQITERCRNRGRGTRDDAGAVAFAPHPQSQRLNVCTGMLGVVGMKKSQVEEHIDKLQDKWVKRTYARVWREHLASARRATCTGQRLERFSSPRL